MAKQTTKKAAAAPTRTIADNTAAKAPTTLTEKANRTFRQGKLATKKGLRQAKRHVSRNRAAYIAGGLGALGGAATGAAAAGIAARNRQKEQD